MFNPTFGCKTGTTNGGKNCGRLPQMSAYQKHWRGRACSHSWSLSCSYSRSHSCSCPKCSHYIGIVIHARFDCLESKHRLDVMLKCRKKACLAIFCYANIEKSFDIKYTFLMRFVSFVRLILVIKILFLFSKQCLFAHSLAISVLSCIYCDCLYNNRYYCHMCVNTLLLF